jgi:hypothetical protein
MLHPTFSVKGEDDLNQKMWNLFNETVVYLKRQCLDHAISHGLVPQKDFRFSRKAGCSCGCSPGFIAKNDSWRGCQYWVEFYSDQQCLKFALQEMKKKEEAENSVTNIDEAMKIAI